ncbi:hypothetical protein ACS0TY_036028 [Phlomoides rotata]
MPLLGPMMAWRLVVWRRIGRGEVSWCFSELTEMEQNVDIAEDFATFQGICCAREQGDSIIIIETDSQRLFYTLPKSKPNLSRFGELVEDILALRRYFSSFNVSLDRRMGNNVAHSLAAFTFTNEGSYFSTIVPTCCFEILEADSMA